MIIHRLTVSGFRIIGEPITVEFPIAGRIAIIGENESGKSTIFEAIACALYGLSKEDISWGKERARLELEFTCGEQTYHITRTISNRQPHAAKLVSAAHGSKTGATLDSVSAIKRRIEEITGTDQDSFTKLVYVKQKDLDALRNLTRAPREELVNKVMGIEIFDLAGKHVDEERSELRSRLSDRKTKLESLQVLKREYDAKYAEGGKLSEQISSLSPQVEQTKASLSTAEVRFHKLQWLHDYTQKRQLLQSQKKQQQNLEEKAKRAAAIRNELRATQALIEKYEPVDSALQTAKAELESYESQLKEAQGSLQALEERTGQLRERLGVMSASGVIRRKATALRASLSVGTLSALSVVGILVFVPFALVTLMLAAVAIHYYRKYSRLEKQSQELNEMNGLETQAKIQEERVTQLVRSKPRTSAPMQFERAEEAATALVRLRAELQAESGQGSIDGLRAKHALLSGEAESYDHDDPERARKELEASAAELTFSLDQLQLSRPGDMGNIEFSEAALHLARGETEAARSLLEQISSELASKNALRDRISQDLNRIQTELTGYSELNEEVQRLEARVEVLSSVKSEYAETSKELRAKVIPQARMIINQVLPTLTNGRYSDFDISEDLKFTVYAVEAKEHKAREIFSGGTQDQFLIALRLAFTQSILDSRISADKYCLLLDECISSSDEARRQGIFDVLELMKGTFAQILIIAHEDISNFVDHHLVMRRNARGYAQVQSTSWVQSRPGIGQQRLAAGLEELPENS